MLQSKPSFRDLRTHKKQRCISKAGGVISKVTGRLVNLENSKTLSPNSLRNTIGPMVHSLALFSHVNSSLEQTRRDNIAYYLDNQYHAL